MKSIKEKVHKDNEIDDKASNTTNIDSLKSEIAKLKNENKKLEMEKNIIESNKTMVAIYTKMKEDYLHEENKLKINSEHANEMDQLRHENEKLKSKIDALERTIEEKNKLINSLPNVLKENINEKKNLSKQKEEIKSNYDNMLRKTISDLNQNYSKNVNTNKLQFEAIVHQKNLEIDKLKNEFLDYKREKEDKLRELNKEMVSLYEITNTYMTNNRKYLDVKRINSTLLSNPNFVNLKGELDKEYKTIYSYITRGNFPYLHSILQSKGRSFTSGETVTVSNEIVEERKRTSTKSIKTNNSVKQEDTLLQKSLNEINEEIAGMKVKTIYSFEDLEGFDKNYLIRIVNDLQKAIRRLADEFQMNSSLKVFGKSIQPRDYAYQAKMKMNDGKNVNHVTKHAANAPAANKLSGPSSALT